MDPLSSSVPPANKFETLGEAKAIEALRKAPGPRFDEKTIPDFWDFLDLCKKKYSKNIKCWFYGG